MCKPMHDLELKVEALERRFRTMHDTLHKGINGGVLRSLDVLDSRITHEGAAGARIHAELGERIKKLEYERECERMGHSVLYERVLALEQQHETRVEHMPSMGTDFDPETQSMEALNRPLVPEGTQYDPKTGLEPCGPDDARSVAWKTFEGHDAELVLKQGPVNVSLNLKLSACEAGDVISSECNGLKFTTTVSALDAPEPVKCDHTLRVMVHGDGGFLAVHGSSGKKWNNGELRFAYCPDCGEKLGGE